MIWCWIIAGILLSLLLCKGYNIRWQHYIWLLLPIEFYGLSIGGTIVKPYMVFGILIFISNLLSHKKFVLPNAIVLITASIIISDCFTGLIQVSVMQHLMFFFVMFIAYQYLIICDFEIQINEIKQVLLATVIGYGLVFVISNICFIINPSMDGLYTVDRFSYGMFEKFLSAGGDFTIRFRGFCIDPNAVVATLVPGGVIAFSNLIAHNYNVKNWLALSLYSIVVVMSGSRMALLCSLVCAIFLLHSKYKLSLNRAKWLCAGFVVIIIICFYSLFENTFYDSIIKMASDKYQARAGLTDKYGRLNIWAYNFNYIIENNKYLFGVGQNQIFHHTQLGLECHNTWLEWICGTGLFIGTFINLWFFSAPYVFWRKIRTMDIRLWRNSQFLFFAYLTTVLCITSIDNITNSILIMSAVLFHYGTPIVNQSNYLLQEAETDQA